MNINITGRNFEITDPLRNFIVKKFEKVAKKLNNPLVADLVLSTENKMASIEMKANFNNKKVNFSLTNPDMYIAINQLVKKMSRKINETKSRNLS